MTSHLKSIYIPLAVILLIVIVEQYSGCKKDESPFLSSPCGDRNRTAYGTGSLSFTLNMRGDSTAAHSQYVPSDQFMNDTIARQGAGGFVHDTLVTSKPLKGMVVGFIHSLHNGVSYDSVLVFKLYDSSGPLTPGDYAFIKSNANPSSKYSDVILLVSDSLHRYSIFQAKNGIFTLSVIDTCIQHIQGTFAGTLWDLSDTSNQIQLTNGQCDITYVDRYFYY